MGFAVVLPCGRWPRWSWTGGQGWARSCLDIRLSTGWVKYGNADWSWYIYPWLIVPKMGGTADTRWWIYLVKTRPIWRTTVAPILKTTAWVEQSRLGMVGTRRMSIFGQDYFKTVQALLGPTTGFSWIFFSAEMTVSVAFINVELKWTRGFGPKTSNSQLSECHFRNNAVVSCHTLCRTTRSCQKYAGILFWRLWRR